MFKYHFVGRLDFLAGILTLLSACAVGEIGGSAGGARSGGPEIGAESPALSCAGASADVSAQNGWRSSGASLPADGALRFEFNARPTDANLDGLVAVGAEDIDDFTKAAITVRFADDGFVDVRDGAFYSSDTPYRYDPGVWYSIAISADVDSETYDVEIAPCGEPRELLVEDASFRDNADVGGQLSTWAVWSSQSAALEISTPTWVAADSCAPATCLSLGHACGEPKDGCGGVLSCGVCGDGQMCSSGTCVDAPANAPPPPPPSCTPATCQSLDTECGQWGDGCGGIMSCGSCNGGDICSAGVCIDVPPNAPPPPACTPASCQSLGAECGQNSDGCGGVLSCGSCSGGATCSNSICVPPPPPTCTPASCQSLVAECGVLSDGCGGVLSCGSCSGGATCSNSICVPPPSPPPPPPPGGTGPKPNASNTGPSNPGALVAWPYGSTYLDTPGAVYENFTSGCLEIDADNVTLRNFIITCNGSYGIQQYNGRQGTLIEDGEITGRLQSSGMFGQGFTARRIYIHHGEGDAIKMANRTPGLTVIEDSFVECMGVGVPEPHTDAVQIEAVVTHPGITFRGNNFDMPNTGTYPRSNCPNAAAASGIFTVTDGNTNITVDGNWLNGGTFTIDVEAAGLNVTNNLFGREYQFGVSRGSFGGTWTNNRWEDTLEIIP